MSTHGACLPGGTGPGQDRWATTPHGVVVLDGATAVEPGTPPADDYVDALVTAVCDRLDATSPLTDVIAGAIRAVAAHLDLHPGQSPSSTVAILRHRVRHVDVAVPGDSTAVLGLRDGGQIRLSDERLQTVRASYRRRIHARLHAGAGYDTAHRTLLADLQTVERQARNTSRGYWIAEADYTAGHHADVRTYPRDTIAWAALATDGAQRPIDHLAIAWQDIAAMDDAALADLLHDLHRWESDNDPHGSDLTRSKRHDDKTLATWAPDPVDR